MDANTVQPSLQVNIPAPKDVSIAQQVESTPIASNMSSNGKEENDVNELEDMNLEEEFNNMQRAARMIRHCHTELYPDFEAPPPSLPPMDNPVQAAAAGTAAAAAGAEVETEAGTSDFLEAGREFTCCGIMYAASRSQCSICRKWLAGKRKPCVQKSKK